MVLGAEFKTGDTTFFEGKLVKIVACTDGYVTIEDKNGNGCSIPKSRLMSTPLFNFYEEEVQKEKDEKRIAEIRKEIQTYEQNKDNAIKAERKNASIIGRMRREWGVTLCDANDAQREEFKTKKKEYYAFGSKAVSWSNKITSAFSIIRGLIS